MSGRHDLERIEANLDAELAIVESRHPLDPTEVFAALDPTDPLTTDPTDVARYEVGLGGLREAVVGMERFEDGLGFD
jgi:hypothetical protein